MGGQKRISDHVFDKIMSSMLKKFTGNYIIVFWPHGACTTDIRKTCTLGTISGSKVETFELMTAFALGSGQVVPARFPCRPIRKN